MSVQLTERENYNRMLRGEMPDFLPFFDMVGWGQRSSLFNDLRAPNGNRVDEFGVEFVPTDSTNGAALPKPGSFLLKDIRKWRDVIKAPDISNIDWEGLARKDTANRDRSLPMILSGSNGYFQPLMSLMGFTEGLCAMYEEPEEVYALFDYLSEYNLEKERHMIKYYKPDSIYVVDDTATAQNPFISMPMYRQLIKPFHKKHCDLALENGLLLQHHNCGRCEDQIDDWLEMGISAWDPAQVSNDLVGIKKKYGRRMCLMGCWDYQGPASWLASPDDMLRDALAEYVDTFAPGGGFGYGAFVLGPTGDEAAERKMKIIKDFYKDYARDWYRSH